MSFEENLGIFYEPEKEGVEKFEMNEKIEMLQKENIELKKRLRNLNVVEIAGILNVIELICSK